MFANLFAARRPARARTARRSESARRPSRKLRVESLEGRVLMDAAPVFDSVVVAAGPGTSLEKSVVDPAGNRYVVGTIMRTVDFDLNNVRPEGSDILTPRGNQDAFVAKYAPDNSLVWA